MLWKAVCSTKLLSHVQLILVRLIIGVSTSVLTCVHHPHNAVPEQMRPVAEEAHAWCESYRLHHNIRHPGQRRADCSQVCVCCALSFCVFEVTSRPISDFRAQFRDTLSKHSPTPRNFYSYLTSVVVRSFPLALPSLGICRRGALHGLRRGRSPCWTGTSVSCTLAYRPN